MEWGPQEPSTEQCNGRGNEVGHLGERERHVAISRGRGPEDAGMSIGRTWEPSCNRYEYLKIAILGPSNSTRGIFFLQG